MDGMCQYFLGNFFNISYIVLKIFPNCPMELLVGAFTKIRP